MRFAVVSGMETNRSETDRGAERSERPLHVSEPAEQTPRAALPKRSDGNRSESSGAAQHDRSDQFLFGILLSRGPSRRPARLGSG